MKIDEQSSIEDIMEAFQCSRATAYYKRKALFGISSRTPKQVKMDNDAELILRLNRRGLSQREIMEVTKKSRSTIYRIIKRNEEELMSEIG